MAGIEDEGSLRHPGGRLPAGSWAPATLSDHFERQKFVLLTSLAPAANDQDAGAKRTSQPI